MPQQKKRKRQKPGRFLNVLVLAIIVLIVFEGKLLINIFQKESIKTQVTSQLDEILSNEGADETEASSEASANQNGETAGTQETEAPLSSPAVVPTQRMTVDDSYFSDAVFIGDSRMEGFRNQSGITQGTFLTGVGMDATSIFTEKYIRMYNEQITVFQALYNTDYKKVYVMIGTNNLGEPDFNEFKASYKTALGEIQKQAPNAILYVMGIAYVEESKVTTGDYVNNQNIDAANEKILELCEEEGYHYLNINEALSNGQHSLIEGATSDGIHMYDTYCKKWLDYLKSHYIPVSEETSTSESGSEIGSESQTETQTAQTSAAE